MMKHLVPGGRCAVVVPEGLLFGSTNAHTELRKNLVEDFDLLAVVSLPAGVFKPYAGVKTAVLVFRRLVEGKKKAIKKIWFYEVKNDGYDPDKIQGGGRLETPEKNEIPGLMKEWRAHKAKSFKNPPGVEAGRVLVPGSEMPSCWWAAIETVEANDYNLAAARYKPRLGEDVPDENPADLIQEVMDIEADIQRGLESLQKQVGEVA